jgi:CelD/BcsL family acetyltransferase involved in cellulose biosynthesis
VDQPAQEEEGALSANGVTIRELPWDTVDPARWESHLSRCPDATFFHTAAWMSALVDSFAGWQGRVLVAEHAAGAWHALLPYVEVHRRGLCSLQSMPFGTFGGPLATDECPDDIIAGLCDRLASRARSWRTRAVQLCEYRNRSMRRLPAAVYSRFAPRTQVTHVLDLSGGSETVWRKRFAHQRRRQAECARRRGLTLRQTVDPADFMAYYEIYRAMTLDRSCRATLPRRLFEKLAELADERIRLWVAEIDGTMVAGNLTFVLGTVAISWNGAMLRASTAYHPAVALHHATIEDVCACGCRTYHLGASPGLPGVARFKEQFGSHPHEIGVWQVDGPLGGILDHLRAALNP